MGVTVSGMDGWLADLDSLPERADKAFIPIMKRAGGNIKDDWSARWTAMPHAHIPHLIPVQAFIYDTDKNGFTYSVEVGVRPCRRTCAPAGRSSPYRCRSVRRYPPRHALAAPSTCRHQSHSIPGMALYP